MKYFLPAALVLLLVLVLLYSLPSSGAAAIQCPMAKIPKSQAEIKGLPLVS
jgi:hypothetical protein